MGEAVAGAWLARVLFGVPGEAAVGREPDGTVGGGEIEPRGGYGGLRLRLSLRRLHLVEARGS